MTDAAETDADTGAALLEAALAHVPFEGWTDAALRGACRDTGIEPALAHVFYPRGGPDLALAFSARCDREMRRRLAATDLSALRFRERVATAVRLRIEAIGDRELLRRSMTLFAMPQNAAAGTQALWDSADAIWTALGDSSDDVNWYTKRATLSGVISATLLYWLGDDSPGAVRTWAFLDRRIENVMQIETVKGKVNSNPVLRPLMVVPNMIGSRIRPPARARRPHDPSAGFPDGEEA